MLLSLIVMGALPLWAGDTPAPQREFKELAAGRYSLRVSGLLCYTCTRAIARELEKLEEVQSIKTDFEAEQLLLEIKIDHVLPVGALRRAMSRASKKVNLGTKFEVVSVQYLP